MKHVYIAYHKPKGVICTTEKIEGNIIDAIGMKENIFPVGRLDKDSEGLILLTSDGSIVNRIIHPDRGHEKEYLVTLNKPLRNQFLRDMAAGVDLGDVRTRPCVIRAEPGTKRVFRIILTQGLNRQIRRMCGVFGYQVLKLQRIRVMHIGLGKLKPGEWRELTEQELQGIL
jgi:23S rRNA pseudouridine2604 synthase